MATTRITSLAAGGDGLGHLEDGRVVFVAGGVPGDLVELRVLKLGKRMAHAQVARVLEASSDRVDPRCRHFGECGGCAWQHIRYEAQLAAKKTIVHDALTRIGGLVQDAEFEIQPSPQPYNYRARARLVETATGIGYRKRQSNEIEPVSECPILVQAAESRLRALVEEKAEDSDALAKAGGERKSGRGKRRREIEREILAGSNGDVVVRQIGKRSPSRTTTSPPDRVSLSVLGEKLEASIGSFVQGNALLWNALAEEVRSQCLLPLSAETPQSGDEESPRLPSRFAELYAGIGFLTLPLARAGLAGVVFESDSSALDDLERNLERGGFRERIRVVRGRVERRRDWRERLATAEVLLLDPPRMGLDEDLRGTIATSGPERVVYVSCDPATLARDLRILVAGGYRLAHLRALDLFPQTPHVEVVVRLERDPGLARSTQPT